MRNSILKLLPIDDIYDNGIIKLKNNFFIKIIEVKPINYNLKSYREKELILNSYKLFLKNCDFNFQIIIQSSKKDLNNYFLEVKEKSQKEEEIIKSISRQYIKNIERINLENKSSIKNFYFIINEKKEISTYTWEKGGFYFVEKISDKIRAGYPLDSISINKKLNKYFTDITPEDKKMLSEYESDVVEFIANSVL